MYELVLKVLRECVVKDRKELGLKEVVGPVSAVQESIVFCWFSLLTR